MRIISRLLRLAILASGPLLVIAWLIGFWSRDQNPRWMWFYFIPAPLVVGAVCCWLISIWRDAGRILRIATAVLALVPLFKIVAIDMHWHRTTETPPDAIRITHWNIARTLLSKGTIQNVIAGDAPDICILSESSTSSTATNAFQRLGLTNFYYATTMSLYSRYPIQHIATLRHRDGRGWCERVATPQGPLDVLAVDLISKPQLDRRPPLESVASWIATHDARIPLIAIGDFNTMRDSVAFGPVRKLLANAYEETSHGWPYSWPLPLPVYEIDHAWYTSGTMTIFNYELRTSFRSDHRRQYMQAQLRGPRS